MAQPSDHGLYPLARWVLAHGDSLVPVAFVLMALLLVAMLALVWLQGGARLIAAVWVWRQAWRWWRSRGRSPADHRGGAGGPAYSSEYAVFMASPQWARQRARVLRRDGHRCTRCGGRGGLEAHHTFYATPIGATPDWAIVTLCAAHHAAAHGRSRAA